MFSPIVKLWIPYDVEVKSEPEDFSLELENQDTSNHEMIEIKDKFAKTMEEFDLGHVK